MQFFNIKNTDHKKRSNIVFKVSGQWTTNQLWKFIYSVNALYDFSILAVFKEIERPKLSMAAKILIHEYNLMYQPSFEFSDIPAPMFGISFHDQVRMCISDSYDLNFNTIDLNLTLKSINISSPGEIKFTGIAAVIKQFREIVDDIRFKKERELQTKFATSKEREGLAAKRIENLDKFMKISKRLNLSAHEASLIVDWAYGKEKNLIQALVDKRLTDVDIED